MFPWWASLLVSLGVLCIVLLLLGVLCIRHSGSRDAFSKLIREDTILPVVGLRNRNVFVYLGEGETAEKIKLFGRNNNNSSEDVVDGVGGDHHHQHQSSSSGGGRRASTSSGDSMIFIPPSKKNTTTTTAPTTTTSSPNAEHNNNKSGVPPPPPHESGHTLLSVTSGGLDAVPADVFVSKAMNHIHFSERKARVFRADSTSFLGGGGGGGGGVDMHSSMLDGASIIEERRGGDHHAVATSTTAPREKTAAGHESTSSSSTRLAAAQSVTVDPRDSVGGGRGIRTVLSSSDITPAATPVNRNPPSSSSQDQHIGTLKKRTFSGKPSSAEDGGEGPSPLSGRGGDAAGRTTPPTREDGEDASNAKKKYSASDNDDDDDGGEGVQDDDDEEDTRETKPLQTEASFDPMDDLL